MASDVEICNTALAKIGERPIASLQQSNSAAATACLNRFATARDFLLRAHDWNFALSRVALARLGLSPAFGWSYAYQLPADMIRISGIWDTPDGDGAFDYRVEGGKVVTDAENVYLLYVARVTDPNLMPTDFREALAIKLASELAIILPQSRELSDQLDQRFRQVALPAARAADGAENPAETIPLSSWVTERDR